MLTHAEHLAREAEGATLRAWREGIGMARRTLAEHVGVSVTVLRRWEEGSSGIPAARREKLQALGYGAAVAA